MGPAGKPSAEEARPGAAGGGMGAANIPGCGGNPRPAAAATAAAVEAEDAEEDEEEPLLLAGSGGVGLWVATGGVPIDGGPLLLAGTPG